MRILIFCCLAIFFIFSCKKKEPPKKILSSSEMAEMLLEVYLAEVKVSATNMPRDSQNKYYQFWQDSLMNRLNIQDSVFKQSYKYYFEHPKLLEDIYSVVIDSLSNRENRLKKDK